MYRYEDRYENDRRLRQRIIAAEDAIAYQKSRYVVASVPQTALCSHSRNGHDKLEEAQKCARERTERNGYPYRVFAWLKWLNPERERIQNQAKERETGFVYDDRFGYRWVA